MSEINVNKRNKKESINNNIDLYAAAKEEIWNNGYKGRCEVTDKICIATELKPVNEIWKLLLCG